MSLLALPEPDAGVLSRRDDIVRQLAKLVPNAVLIADEEGRRTFETDALTPIAACRSPWCCLPAPRK
jgi:glycolate oxidase